jgi:PncC family amidohydrolase
MNEQLIEIISILTKQHKTIATMESCTGGGLANAITNIEGSSEVLKFSAVTYSNEYKIKLGVNPDIIEQYSVYSMEVSIEMSEKISLFTNANYGVGITGKLNRVDKNNPFGEDNIVFISIYDKDNNKHYNYKVEATEKSRSENKALVINYIVNNLMEIINN